MRQKLYDLKLILRVIISCFVVFSMLKSCVKAYTGQDVVDYVNDTADYFSSNSKYQTIKTAVNTSTCKSWLNSNAGNYNVIYIYWKENANNWYQGCRIELYNDSDNNIVNQSNVPVCAGSGIARQFATNNSAGSQINLGSTNNLSYCASVNENQENTLWGMCLTDCNVSSDFKTFVGKQAMAPQNPLSFTNRYTNNLNYNNEVVQYGTFSYSQNQIFIDEVTGIEGNTVKFNLAYLTFNDVSIKCECTQVETNYCNISVPTRLLEYSKLYTLTFYTIIEGNEWEISENIVFFPNGTVVTNGTITSIPSGDFSYNIQDSTNDIITNQDNSTQEIISTISGVVGSVPDYDLSGDTSGDSSGFIGGSGILGGIFGLFVPKSNFFKLYINDVTNWFSDHLGLLWYPFEFTINFLNRLLTVDYSEPTLSIGPYVLPFNNDFELVPEITIRFNDFLVEEHAYQLHETYLFLVDGLIIIGIINLIHTKYDEFMSGDD